MLSTNSFASGLSARNCGVLVRLETEFPAMPRPPLLKNCLTTCPATEKDQFLTMVDSPESWKLICNVCVVLRTRVPRLKETLVLPGRGELGVIVGLTTAPSYDKAMLPGIRTVSLFTMTISTILLAGSTPSPSGVADSRYGRVLITSAVA